jgi:hypothetical protein
MVLTQTAANAPSPFMGEWSADLDRSKLHRNSPLRAATLTFEVTPDIVVITDSSQNAAGQQIGTGTTTLSTDGRPHPQDQLLPGLVVVARWRAPRLLETILTRPNGVSERVTYEVADDGQTLTTRTQGPLGEQTIVFTRRK